MEKNEMKSPHLQQIGLDWSYVRNWALGVTPRSQLLGNHYADFLSEQSKSSNRKRREKQRKLGLKVT